MGHERVSCYTICFSKQRHLEFSRLYNRFVLVVSQYVISLVQQVNYFGYLLFIPTETNQPLTFARTLSLCSFFLHFYHHFYVV